MARLMGDAVQTRIGYRQCECGRRKCRAERKAQRRLQRRVENQQVRKLIERKSA